MPPRTILPDARTSPRFSGIATFCRYPRHEDVPAENQPVDWALYGYPFDGGVTYRPGARFAPRAIRDASQYVKPYHLVHDVNVCEVLSLADAGDAPVHPYSARETLEAAVQFAAALGDPAGTRLLAVGGDHTLAYANIKATWLRRGRPAGGLALIHFDSHLDTVDTVWGEKWTHASPFIRLIEEGIVDPQRMLSLGVKGPLNRRDDLEFARSRGVTLITGDEPAPARDARVAEFLSRLGEDETYVTFDIDCVDPAFAPGTGTPCPGGYTSAEVLALLRSLRGVNIVGADVVEVLPDRDPAGITAFLAAHVIFELLALSALRPQP